MPGKVRLPSVNVGDVETICTDATTRWTVHDGVAPAEVEPPFVSIFPLDMINNARGLAAEDWGTLDAVFQISCFGETVDQARWLAEQIIQQAGWVDGWELSPDIPPPISDNVPAPTWVLVPLTFRHHG